MDKELVINHKTGDREIREVSLDLPSESPRRKALNIILLEKWCLEVEKQLKEEGKRINCPIPVKEIED